MAQVTLSPNRCSDAFTKRGRKPGSDRSKLQRSAARKVYLLSCGSLMKALQTRTALAYLYEPMLKASEPLAPLLHV